MARPAGAPRRPLPVPEPHGRRPTAQCGAWQVRGLKQKSSTSGMLSHDKLNTLLEQLAGLPVAHRYQALQEMMLRIEPQERLDLLHGLHVESAPFGAAERTEAALALGSRWRSTPHREEPRSGAGLPCRGGRMARKPAQRRSSCGVQHAGTTCSPRG